MVKGMTIRAIYVPHQLSKNKIIGNGSLVLPHHTPSRHRLLLSLFHPPPPSPLFSPPNPSLTSMDTVRSSQQRERESRQGWLSESYSVSYLTTHTHTHTHTHTDICIDNIIDERVGEGEGEQTGLAE